MEINWKSVDEYPEMDLIQDDENGLVERNDMNPCLVTDGEHFQEAYMIHLKPAPYETLGKTTILPETWEWYWDHRDNPINQEMILNFKPTHWVYIKDIKPKNKNYECINECESI